MMGASYLHTRQTGTIRCTVSADAFIDFSSSEYHVSENDGRTVLRIEVTYGDLGRPVELLLSTRDGTAEGKEHATSVQL